MNTISSIRDCRSPCPSDVVYFPVPCTICGGILTVDNTAALRQVFDRTPNMEVNVLSDIGTPIDGTGWIALWRPDDLTPDGPPLSTRPDDIPNDGLPGRFRQWI